MQIVPVLDILNGVVVHGRAGERETYQPVKSRLTESTAPLELLKVLANYCRAKKAYVADLNGLMNGAVQETVLKQLADQNIELMIDAGIRCSSDVDLIPEGDHVQLVLASEAVPSQAVLQAIISDHPNRRFVFSFDLVNGELKTPVKDWACNSIRHLASVLWDFGISDWIVLDMRSVGMATGPTTTERCERLKSQFPAVRLTTGGGIRHREDLQAFAGTGASEILLATALHDMTITEVDLKTVAAG